MLRLVYYIMEPPISTKALKAHVWEFFAYTCAYTKSNLLTYDILLDITHEAVYTAILENKIEDDYIRELIRKISRKYSIITQNEIKTQYIDLYEDIYGDSHPLDPVASDKTYGGLANALASKAALRLNKRQLFILNSVRQGMSQRAIAEALGTKQINISLCLKNICKTIYNKLSGKEVKGHSLLKVPKKLYDSMINIDKQIIDLHRLGYRNKDICDKLGLNYMEVAKCIYDARHGICRKQKYDKQEKVTISWKEHKKRVNAWNRKNRHKTTDLLKYDRI